MIRRIKAENFRRHESLELAFDEESQIVLISGANGAGKSTILEAVVFALWGESRHGRRNLDQLVSRGAELEGMFVELEFEVAGSSYKVHRRREGRASSAVLYHNENPLVEGPIQVSQEISSILGMDSVGFRLAVIAQQKDLDGLASLRPAERAQTIARLLRLDVLSAARAAAQERFRRSRDLARELTGSNFDEIEKELETVEKEKTEVEKQLSTSSEALAVLSAEYATLSASSAKYQAALEKTANIKGRLELLYQTKNQLQNKYDTLEVPSASEPTKNLHEVSDTLRDLEGDIVRAQTNLEAYNQRSDIETELQSVLTLQQELQTKIKNAALQPSCSEFETQLEELNSSLEQGRETYSSLRSTMAALKQQKTSLEESLAKFAAQEGVCDTCGQEITQEHATVHVEELNQSLTSIEEQLSVLKTEEQDLTKQATELKQEVEQVSDLLSNARKNETLQATLKHQEGEAQRRIEVYTKQLSRLPETKPDLEKLYATKTRLSLEQVQLEEATALYQKRISALQVLASLKAELEENKTAIESGEKELEAAKPSKELQSAYERREELEDKIREQTEIQNSLLRAQAVLEQRAVSSCEQLSRAKAQSERAALHQTTALNHSAAARLISASSEYLTSSLRPALEGAVSEVLSSMSGGRFTQVKFDEDFNITVLDRGAFVTLGELSGGEVDLVALSVRLALAQIVSERHGKGGAGFLILDECFGSQDPERRTLIMDSLRSLRHVYSQIFLISHVENIEDVADTVIEVSLDPEDETTQVRQS